MAAPNIFGGLLGQPMVDLGTGLLASSGWSNTPVSFGQALGQGMQYASARQIQQMQLQAARAQAEDERKRKEALAAMFAQPMTPGPVSVPTGRAPIHELAQMMGMPSSGSGQAPGSPALLSLMATAYPDQFGQYAMQQAFSQQQQPPRVSTELSTFAALNPELQLGTPEFRSEFGKWATQNDLPENLTKQLELQIMGETLEAARADRQSKERTEQQQNAATRRGIIEGGHALVEMYRLNEELEGTALESGLPFPEVRRAIAGGTAAVQRLLGVDSSTADSVIESYDSFNKYSNDFVVESLDRMAGTGAISIPKFEALVSANANPAASPGTNATVIRNNIEATLEAAEYLGVTLPNESELRAILEAAGDDELTPEEQAELDQLRRQQGAL